MKYIYRTEFIKRENFSKSLNSNKHIEILNKNGFVKLNLSDVSKKNEFVKTIIKFKKKFDEINQNSRVITQKKDYLRQYNFEFNEEVRNLADPFVDLVTKYLGSLPILDSVQLWYSPNETYELICSRLPHRDPEDFKQVKVFIPIEEIQLENGPLHLIDKHQSQLLYENLINKNLITKRNQKIEDKYVSNLNLRFHPMLLNNNECALVDTCACYHFGSRKGSKPRKLLFLHFTTAFSGKTPIFRNYDTEKKFFSEKDKLVYGLQKKTINQVLNNFKNKKGPYGPFFYPLRLPLQTGPIPDLIDSGVVNFF